MAPSKACQASASKKPRGRLGIPSRAFHASASKKPRGRLGAPSRAFHASASLRSHLRTEWVGAAGDCRGRPAVSLAAAQRRNRVARSEAEFLAEAWSSRERGLRPPATPTACASHTPAGGRRNPRTVAMFAQKPPRSADFTSRREAPAQTRPPRAVTQAPGFPGNEPRMTASAPGAAAAPPTRRPTRVTAQPRAAECMEPEGVEPSCRDSRSVASTRVSAGLPGRARLDPLTTGSGLRGVQPRGVEPTPDAAAGVGEPEFVTRRGRLGRASSGVCNLLEPNPIRRRGGGHRCRSRSDQRWCFHHWHLCVCILFARPGCSSTRNNGPEPVRSNPVGPEAGGAPLGARRANEKRGRCEAV